MNDEALFHLALEKSIGERSAFLEQACAGDEALRHRVEAGESIRPSLPGPATGRHGRAEAALT